VERDLKKKKVEENGNSMVEKKKVTLLLSTPVCIALTLITKVKVHIPK
jgi:hypothetical protein